MSLGSNNVPSYKDTTAAEVSYNNVASKLTAQNAQAALSVADRAYVLETGKVVMSGTGKELLTSDEIRKAYLGA